MTTTLTEKTFAQLFTYSGGAGGTCVNAQGWIQPSATPRLDHDPVTKTAKGLLIESTRTNLLGYSSRFDLAIAWPRSGLVAVIPEAAISPAGRWDACKVVLSPGAAPGTPFISRAITKDASAIQYTSSLYVKAAGFNTCTILITGATSSDRANFGINLTTKATSVTLYGGFTAASVKMFDAGNGWYRLEGTVTSDASTGLAMRIYPSDSVVAIDGVNGIYVWGAQIETGPFATSYIPSAEAFTSRASLGSYFDANGIMRIPGAGAARWSYEPSNLTLAPVLLLEGQSTNLLQKTSDMHLVPWTVTGANRATGKLAPDGTLRAVEVSGTPTVPFVHSGVVATATAMTYSVYVKNVSRTAPIAVLLRNGTTSTNFATGLATIANANPYITGAGWEIRSAGNGWNRCTFTQTTGISVGDTLSCYIGFTGGGPDAGAFQIWGAQLEAGTFATSYIPSTETFTGRASIGTYFDAAGALKTAAAGAARLTYNPANLSVSPWLLLEGQSTNLLTESEFRNGLADAPTNTGVTAAAMSGFAGAIQFPAGGATTIYAIKAPALTASTIYSLSVVVEMDDGQPPDFGGGTSAPGNSFCLVLANAAYPTHTYSVQSLGGARWRVSGTFTSPATITSMHTGVYRYSQNQSRGFKITAIQLEQAAFVSSYIPTTTAQVTRVADTSTSATTTRVADNSTSTAMARGADVARIDAAKGWFNLAEGTLAMECRLPQTPDVTNRTLVEFGNGTTANRMGLAFQAAGAVYGYSNINGAGVSASSVTPPGPIAKVSLSYGADGLRTGCNGGLLSKVATPAVPPVTFLGLGCISSGSNQPCFHIRDVNYFPQRLTDADVIALTV